MMALVALTWRGREPRDGCVRLAGRRYCVPTVSVNGKLLAPLALVSGMVGQPSTDSTVREAIASGVFDRVLYLEGVRGGIRASTAQARAMARRELGVYRRYPQPAAFNLPPGVSGRDYFLAPRTVEAYRVGMVVGKERDGILRQHPGSRDAVAFPAWFKTALAHYTVRINGRQPTFSLPAALAASLRCPSPGRASC